MAKPLVKITSNFSFAKLKFRMDKILDFIMSEVGKAVEGSTKRTITDDNVLRPLQLPTKQRRMRGTSSWEKMGHNPKNTSDTRPLHYTGDLVKSIKGTKEGLEMNAYGLEHEKGFNTPEGSSVLPREFIAKDEKDFADLEDRYQLDFKLVNKMNKAMKK